VALAIRPASLHRRLERWADRHGPVYRLRIGPSRLLVLSEPDTILAVLRARPEGFSRSVRLRRVALELGLKDGVFSAGGDDWRVQRAMVGAALSPANVKRWLPSMSPVLERLRARLVPAAASGSPIELQPTMMRFTVDTVAGLALGADVDTSSGRADTLQRDLDRLFPALFERAMAPLPRWRWFRTAADRELAAAIVRIDRTIETFVADARRRLSEDPRRVSAPPNLLEAMLVAGAEGVEGIDDDIVAGNVLTMLLAGEDTTANTLAWTLHFLAAHPEALARAVAEVDAEMPDGHVCEVAVLERLVWLDACALEALRLEPVAPILPVDTIAATTIHGVEIPAGTVVINLMRQAAVDPERIEDAAAFRPERWLADAASRMPPRVSMPFGAGPRLCPGRWLALLEIRAALSMLLGEFTLEDVSTEDGSPPVEHLAFTMAPAGLRMRLSPRAGRECAPDRDTHPTPPDRGARPTPPGRDTHRESPGRGAQPTPPGNGTRRALPVEGTRRATSSERATLAAQPGENP